jgi:hypothetical protein
MFRKILNFCLNEPARSAAGRITDGARKTLGVSIDILYTLDSASNYSVIQKFKP